MVPVRCMAQGDIDRQGRSGHIAAVLPDMEALDEKKPPVSVVWVPTGGCFLRVG